MFARELKPKLLIKHIFQYFKTEIFSYGNSFFFFQSALTHA